MNSKLFRRSVAASRGPSLRRSNFIQRRLRGRNPARWILVLLLFTLPSVAQAQFNYTINIDLTITITGYTGSGGAVNIPSSINGLPVRSIGNSAFYECWSLISVTIPYSVTSIGDSAFESCPSLSTVSIGSGVTNIGTGAFALCRSLTSVTIPNSVITIRTIAFQTCTSLTNVAIPSSVTSIGDAAFEYCFSLTAITVDALNPTYSSLDGVLFNKTRTTLITCPGGKAGSYTIPDGITNIGDYAFYPCPFLTAITIPDSVTRIGQMAIYGCTNLTVVTIPNSVTTIANYTFAFCPGLTNVTIGNSVTSIGDGAFSNSSNLTGIYFMGNPPSLGGGSVFWDDDRAIVYYLLGTTGWGTSFSGRPALPCNPQVQTDDPGFGVRTNQFGFKITGSYGLGVVVEACTNLANPIWSPLATNTLTSDSVYFSDPQWTNYPRRLYRIRSP